MSDDDAFGVLLLECWEQGGPRDRLFSVVERDDGYLFVLDVGIYLTDLADWDPLDKWACSRAQGRVLDIGAGAGRHALHLQQLGHDVVALDVSPLAGEVSRRRGVANTFTGTVSELADESPEPFDTFLLLGGNLGLLGGKQAAAPFLAQLERLAAPGAIIITHAVDMQSTVDPAHIEYGRCNRTEGKLAGEWRVRVRHRALATEWFDYLFASIDEVEELLGGTSWRVAEHEPDGYMHAAVLSQRISQSAAL